MTLLKTRDKEYPPSPLESTEAALALVGAVLLHGLSWQLTRHFDFSSSIHDGIVPVQGVHDVLWRISNMRPSAIHGGILFARRPHAGLRIQGRIIRISGSGSSEVGPGIVGWGELQENSAQITATRRTRG